MNDKKECVTCYFELAGECHVKPVVSPSTANVVFPKIPAVNQWCGEYLPRDTGEAYKSFLQRIAEALEFAHEEIALKRSVLDVK